MALAAQTIVLLLPDSNTQPQDSAKALAAIVEKLIKLEGGYVNHPADKGGETRYGITLATARAHGYMGDMRYLPRNTAHQIYQRDYVRLPRYDRVHDVSAPVAAKLIDLGVHVSPRRATTWLQRALGDLSRNGADYPAPPVTGVIDDPTLKALRALQRKRGAKACDLVIKAVEGYQAAYYLELGQTKGRWAFTAGWLDKRIGNVRCAD
ncbi:MAG: hypothetical protein KIG95_04670 [Comamonas sp.]|nr:hypothetical protein [Comamonas sp.]